MRSRGESAMTTWSGSWGACERGLACRRSRALPCRGEAMHRHPVRPRIQQDGTGDFPTARWTMTTGPPGGAAWRETMRPFVVESFRRLELRRFGCESLRRRAPRWSTSATTSAPGTASSTTSARPSTRPRPPWRSDGIFYSGRHTTTERRDALAVFAHQCAPRPCAWRSGNLLGVRWATDRPWLW